MKESLEHIVFYRELDTDGRKHLREELEADPGASAAFEAWRGLHEGVRARIERAVRDTHLFTLCALHRSGHSLSNEEKAAVADASSEFDRAREAHPGLQSVAADIAEAASAFEALWDEWIAENEPAPAASLTARPTARPRRVDRRVSRRTPVRYLTRGAIAAAVVVFVALLAMLIRRDMQTVTVSTADGETRIVELGEGSTVRLLAGSTLSYVPPEVAGPVDGRAELRGSAFFQIASGAHGFVVTTETARVTVLGTSFGVQSNERETQVVLAEGRLTLSARSEPSRSVILEAGQMSAVSTSRFPSAPRNIDVAESLDWTGLFVFAATPLKHIASKLSEHYETEISVDPSLTDERVTGTFSSDQSLHEILEIIASTLGVAVRASSSGGYALIPA